MRDLFRGTLKLAQQAAKIRFIDTCTITRPGTGTRTLDPETGRYVTSPDTLVWRGECELKRLSSDAGSEVDHASRDAVTALTVLRIPADAPALIRPGDLVQITGMVNPARQAATYVIRREGDGMARSARSFVVEVSEWP